jgi:hypothetical protein
MKTKQESAPAKKKTSAREKSTEKIVAPAETAAPPKAKSPRAKRTLLEGITAAAKSILNPKRQQPAASDTEVTAETLVRRTYTRKKKTEPPAILLEGDSPAAPSASGPGQKYSLGATPPSQSFGAEADLPESYGTKKLFITARDPHWLYAHWDLTHAQQVKLNALSTDGHLVLRIYPQKIEGHPLYEIHVHPESRHWFAHVERAGNSYVAELGYYSELGRWTRISVSSGTMTPPDAVSMEDDTEFATIPFEFPFARLMEIIKAAVRDNLPLAQAIEELRHNGHPDLPRVTTAPPSTWTPQQEQALSKVVNIDKVRRVWMGSLEITELIRRKLAHEISSLGVSSFSASSLTSPFGGMEKSKGFWFNVNAELIIYGATEPDAKVTLGGHDIKLRSDGSFSFRFALPDGKYDLPAIAISADGTDKRSADLRFSRETQYLGDVGAHPQDPSLKAPLVENL